MPDMKEEAKLTDEEYDLLLKYVAIMQESVPIKKLNNWDYINNNKIITLMVMLISLNLIKFAP